MRSGGLTQSLFKQNAYLKFICQKVVASNPQGKAEKKVYLDLADPPVFIEPLQEKTISSKSFLKLVCRVDGIPYPEVKWSKDWKPITGKLKGFASPSCRVKHRPETYLGYSSSFEPFSVKIHFT